MTAGIGEDVIAERFKRANDDYSAIMVSALADRLAEAFAERLHQNVRKEFWGYAPDEALSNDDLIAEKYHGIRPAPGYPAAARPHREGHAVQAARARAHRRQADRELCDVAGRRGVRLVFQPSAKRIISASARSSAIRSRITPRRKGWSVEEAERWLAPILNYNPHAAAQRTAAA